MPENRSRPLAAVAIVGMLLVTVPGVLYAGDTEPGRFDRWIRPRIITTETSAALTIDWVGEPIGRTLAVAAVAIACLALKRKKLAIVTLAGAILTSAVAIALKPLVDRTIHGDFLSYPSGHTAVIAALGAAAGLLLAELFRTSSLAGALLVVGAGVIAGAVMAWSQITLDAHYPTDTLGGIGVALAVVPTTAWLTDRVKAT